VARVSTLRRLATEYTPGLRPVFAGLRQFLHRRLHGLDAVEPKTTFAPLRGSILFQPRPQALRREVVVVAKVERREERSLPFHRPGRSTTPSEGGPESLHEALEIDAAGATIPVTPEDGKRGRQTTEPERCCSRNASLSSIEHFGALRSEPCGPAHEIASATICRMWVRVAPIPRKACGRGEGVKAFRR